MIHLQKSSVWCLKKKHTTWTWLSASIAANSLYLAILFFLLQNICLNYTWQLSAYIVWFSFFFFLAKPIKVENASEPQTSLLWTRNEDKVISYALWIGIVKGGCLKFYIFKLVGGEFLFIQTVSSCTKWRLSLDSFEVVLPKYFATFLPHDGILDGKICGCHTALNFSMTAKIQNLLYKMLIFPKSETCNHFITV